MSKNVIYWKNGEPELLCTPQKKDGSHWVINGGWKLVMTGDLEGQVERTGKLCKFDKVTQAPSNSEDYNAVLNQARENENAAEA